MSDRDAASYQPTAERHSAVTDMSDDAAVYHVDADEIGSERYRPKVKQLVSTAKKHHAAVAETSVADLTARKIDGDAADGWATVVVVEP